jgi:hypothetical protein
VEVVWGVESETGSTRKSRSWRADDEIVARTDEKSCLDRSEFSLRALAVNKSIVSSNSRLYIRWHKRISVKRISHFLEQKSKSALKYFAENIDH